MSEKKQSVEQIYQATELPDAKKSTGINAEVVIAEYALTRTEMLIGKEAIEKLRNTKVAVFGLGGVGSYVVEALARSGIGSFVLIDHDLINLTNLNRQLIATYDTIGMPKVEAARIRINSINPQAKVEAHQLMYLPDKDNLADLIGRDTDYVIDAVDNMSAKISLVVEAKKISVPIISSMGTGNKLDPLQFEVADIYQTSVCPLSRIMRRELRKLSIEGLKVVYSKEQPRTVPGRRAPASISFVPPVAGLIIAGEVIKDIIGYN
jgi:tRNA A37 threonylcarbamoyladenosine dehydratase